VHNQDSALLLVALSALSHNLIGILLKDSRYRIMSTAAAATNGHSDGSQLDGVLRRMNAR
jgi:hypothetical protein